MLQSYDPRNAEILVWVGDGLVPRDQAKVSVFDSAVQGGDAVWEGMRVYQEGIFCLDRHLDRLMDSAQAMAFAHIPSREFITDAIKATLKANGMTHDTHIRLTLTRGEKITSGMDPRLNQFGPTLIVLAEHKAPVYSTAGLSLITSSVRRFPPDCLDPKIHHNNLLQSILAKIEANASGADDAVMLDLRGFVAETNATHLFLVDDGIVRTPRTTACPEGITRATVLELCAAHGITHEVADLSLAEFYRADEVFCTGTMGELAAVTKIDGRQIGNGSVGSLTSRLSALFRERTRHEGTVVCDHPEPGARG